MAAADKTPKLLSPAPAAQRDSGIFQEVTERLPEVE